MKSILRDIGVFVFIVILLFAARNPKTFTNLVRELIGPETPTAVQMDFREIRDRVSRGQQYTPRVFSYQPAEGIKSELNK